VSDFEIAVQRLTSWLKKHQDDVRVREFIGDLTLVLLVAKDSQQLTARLAAAEAARDEWKRAAVSMFNDTREYDACNNIKGWCEEFPFVANEAAKGGCDE
jgi:hypothetical protein